MDNKQLQLTSQKNDLKPHSIYHIKSILSGLFPNSTVKFDAKFFNSKIDKSPVNRVFIYEQRFSLRYAGKQGTENHHYTIEARNAADRERLDKIIKKIYKDATALNNIWDKRNENHYKNFGFESQAEVAIAIEFSRRQILFFSNPTCLIHDRSGNKSQKRPDFLVIYKGKARILEVDGGEFHENAFEDYKRDRTFERHGLRTTRFTGDECLTNPELVVDEFLELFNQGINLESELERIIQKYQSSTLEA
jgi:Protein of unknown function (DUF559)